MAKRNHKSLSKKKTPKKKVRTKSPAPKEFDDYLFFNALVDYLFLNPISVAQGKRDIQDLVTACGLVDDPDHVSDLDIVNCIKLAENFYQRRFSSYIPQLRINMLGRKRSGKHGGPEELDAVMWEETNTVSGKNAWIRIPIDASIFFEGKRHVREGWLIASEKLSKLHKTEFAIETSYLTFLFDSIVHEICHVLHTHLKDYITRNGKTYTYNFYSKHFQHDFMFWEIYEALNGKKIQDELVSYYLEDKQHDYSDVSYDNVKQLVIRINDIHSIYTVRKGIFKEESDKKLEELIQGVRQIFRKEVADICFLS